ncbi:MAG: hypothetical protein ACLF0G_05215 [Candidatus Brocadiia bacterium]
MPPVSLRTADGQRAFQPGQEVAGTAAWQLPEAPAKAEVCLFWFTEGKGTQDVEVADRAAFDGLAASDERPFRLQLGDGPFSFSGKLISLRWAIELVTEEPHDTERLDIVVSPTGREVVLGEGP